MPCAYPCMQACMYAILKTCKYHCTLHGTLTTVQLKWPWWWRLDMPERFAPSVRTRQLARDLRRLREAAAMTGDAVASRLGWSSAKVSRIETARTPVTVPDLRKLLELYRV